MHKKRPAMGMSKVARRREFSRQGFSAMRRAILTVIVLAMMTVILAVLTQSMMTPENTVKRKVESIAADYYERYYYDLILNQNAVSEGELAQIMERYVGPGFAKVPFSQLTLYDGQKYAEAGKVLNEYCDDEQSYIKIYPEAPFGRKDYHVEYHYSCNF